MNKVSTEAGVSGAPVPEVSVALAVYNGAQYLGEAIDSILAQTFTNFELIVIDDGSTDDTLAILRKFEAKDARVRVVSRENRELATTLNEIIDLARGKWIARMDSDDIALPNRFAAQLRWLEQTGADMCGSWVQLFGADFEHPLKHAISDAAIRMELLFGTPFAHPTVMMKTALIRDLRYDKAWEKCEDYDLWERAASAGWKMANVPEILLRYRQHPAQITSSTYGKNRALSASVRRRYHHVLFKQLGLPEIWIDELMKLRDDAPAANMDYVDAAFRALLSHADGEAREVVLDHATRLYFRAAANCPDVATRWSKLNTDSGIPYSRLTFCKLAFLGVLRIGPDSRLFQQLKKLFFFVSR